MRLSNELKLLRAIAAVILVSGCASPALMTQTTPHGPWLLSTTYSGHQRNDTTSAFRAQDCGDFGSSGSTQVEYGKRRPIIDSIGWITGIPEKLLLWDRRATNHNVSPRTVRSVERYLTENQVSGVMVRVNQYAPLDEWRRLRQNNAVNPFIRYTFGAFRTLGDTILPGRLFGTDNYNPFTNTVSLYSDIPAVGLHEAAYAQDNRQQTYPGLYGIGQHISVVNLIHETAANRQAYTWIQQSSDPELQAEGNKRLLPLHGMRIGSSIAGVVPTLDAPLTIAGAITGHVVGAYRENKRSEAANASHHQIRNVSHEITNSQPSGP